MYTDHDLSFSDIDETLNQDSLKWSFKEGADGTISLEKLEGNNLRYNYALTVTSSILGVSTKYYIKYGGGRYRWIRKISNPSDERWEVNRDRYDTDARVCGSAANIKSIADQIKITPYAGVEIVSQDEPDEEKNELVLHLKHTATGKETNYRIRYYPATAELSGIEDEGNVIYSTNSDDYKWYGSDHEYECIVTGKNATLGNAWKAIAGEGCTAGEPVKATEEDSKLAGTVTVTRDSDGVQTTYKIYYYQESTSDESSSEGSSSNKLDDIIGISDSENVFTNMYISSRNYDEGKSWYNIRLAGKNSKLGKNLTVYTRPGLTATVDYTATGDNSGDYTDAHIQIAGDGNPRDYYVSYGKMQYSTHIRSISSTGDNTFYKVLLEDDRGRGDEENYSYRSYVSIIGSNPEQGALKINLDEGYHSEWNDSKLDIIRDSDGKIIETCYFYYSYIDDKGQSHSGEETTTLKPVKVSSATDPKLHMQSVSTYSKEENLPMIGEIQLIGELSAIPEDTVFTLNDKTEVKLDSAGGNTAYRTITVGNGNDQGVYHVYYQPNDSGAKLTNLLDDSFVDINISSSSNSRYLKNSSSWKQVYLCWVLGTKDSLGKNFQTKVSKNATVTKTVYSEDSDWPYENESGGYSPSIEDEYGYYQTYNFKEAALVEVTAENGAKRTYVIMYAQKEQE